MINYLRLIRPAHIIKNILVFFPLFFSGYLFEYPLLINNILAFTAFSIAASAVYIFNDMCDSGSDKTHPLKKDRPIASGIIKKRAAGILFAVMVPAGPAIGFLVSAYVASILVIYLFINILYSLFLKRVTVTGLVILAAGYILRIAAGAAATGVTVSGWIILLTFLLAWFIGLNKRRNDLAALSPVNSGMDEVRHKTEYIWISVTGVMIIFIYLLWALSPEVTERLGSDKLWISAVFVTAALLRYIYIAIRKQVSANPVTMFLSDPALIGCSFGWELFFTCFFTHSRMQNENEGMQNMLVNTGKSKTITGWGRRDSVTAEILQYRHTDQGIPLSGNQLHPGPVIPRGNGRSYGDSSLQKNVICSRCRHAIHDFDEETGVLECDSGVLLSEIIHRFLPRGWFLPVTPGTSAITTGGAVAADVHGKNHHHAGCFSEFVERIDLVTAGGKHISCSKEQNPEFFHATCGGMGLTGYITRIRMRLVQVPSGYIRQASIRTRSLSESIDALYRNRDAPYSVAWVDLQKKGVQMGRGVIQLGRFAGPKESESVSRGTPPPAGTPRIRIPEKWPGRLIGKTSVSLFNAFWYATNREKETRRDLYDFMYPLDKVAEWNRLYGNKGLIQYQIILPEASVEKGFHELVSILNRSDYICTLAVLKNHGEANRNYLSFPLKGCSLAMDFKPTPGLRKLIPKLNALAETQGGRINLCKDSLMDKNLFDKGYPEANRFRAFRKKHHLNHQFQSFQSNRLGI